MHRVSGGAAMSDARCIEGPRLPPAGECIATDGSNCGAQWHSAWRWRKYALGSGAWANEFGDETAGGDVACVDVEVASCGAPYWRAML